MTEAARKFMNMSIKVALLLFAIRCLISLGSLTEAINTQQLFDFGYSVFGFAGEAIGIAALIMTAFNNWWWKWQPFNILAGGMPVLSEKYSGTIKYQWERNECTKTTDLVIHQTFLSVVVQFGSDESSSNTVTGVIETINNEKQLVYIYLNIPEAQLQAKSPIHYGTTMLKIDDPKHITGEYYTSRLTRGHMDFKAV